MFRPSFLCSFLFIISWFHPPFFFFFFFLLSCFRFLLFLFFLGAEGATLGTRFSSLYRIDALPIVPSLPGDAGAVLFDDQNAQTLLIGSGMNTAQGRIYSVQVSRNAAGKIIGFQTAATRYRSGQMGSFNDGGMVFASNGVLLLARAPENRIGQVKQSSLVEDKNESLPTFVTSSIGPFAFSISGRFKFASFASGAFYDSFLIQGISNIFFFFVSSLKCMH